MNDIKSLEEKLEAFEDLNFLRVVYFQLGYIQSALADGEKIDGYDLFKISVEFYYEGLKSIKE